MSETDVTPEENPLYSNLYGPLQWSNGNINYQGKAVAKPSQDVRVVRGESRASAIS
jgi:hypothetical protein